MIDGSPLVFSFGGGRDGTAALIEMRKRGIRPDRIQFADTGRYDLGPDHYGEKPETYLHVENMDRLTREWWGIPITWVRNDGVYGTLENECLSVKNLPSIVYGFKSCSDKYKRRPIQKDIKRWDVAIQTWENGGHVVVGIGYNASESHRAHDYIGDPGFLNWYPLIEWRITSREVARICERELGYIPLKSACFFCGSTKPSEVVWLSNNHPDLFARAVALEHNAFPNLTDIKGLGRHWSFEEVARATENQMGMFPDTVNIPCMCFDGEDE